jgi:hypothetical protein
VISDETRELKEKITNDIPIRDDMITVPLAQIEKLCNTLQHLNGDQIIPVFIDPDFG